MALKICIVGFSPTTRDLAPTSGDWQYWGLNHLYPHVDRNWAMWFEMHNLRWIKDRSNRWPDYLDWMRELRQPPLMMQEHYNEIPASVSFPIDDVCTVLRLKNPYFASTVAYMLAYAISRKPDEIGIYGLDMVKEDEYIVQRANFEFFIGIAHGLGIKVTVPEQSSLLKSAWQYGYEASPVDRFEKEREDQIERCKDLDAEVAAAVSGINVAKSVYHTNHGALQESRQRLEHLDDLLRGALYGQRGGDTLGTEAEEWTGRKPTEVPSLKSG